MLSPIYLALGSSFCLLSDETQHTCLGQLQQELSPHLSFFLKELFSSAGWQAGKESSAASRRIVALPGREGLAPSTSSISDKISNRVQERLLFHNFYNDLDSNRKWQPFTIVSWLFSPSAAQYTA